MRIQVHQKFQHVLHKENDEKSRKNIIPEKYESNIVVLNS